MGSVEQRAYFKAQNNSEKNTSFQVLTSLSKQEPKHERACASTVAVVPFPQTSAPRGRSSRRLRSTDRAAFRHRPKANTHLFTHKRHATHTNNKMCLSPPLSSVQIIDSLSPPPTPGRERFPVQNEPTPLFFPASASLIHNNAQGKMTRTTCGEQEAYFLELMSRPVSVPTFKLSRRGRRRVNADRQHIDFDVLPPPPFDFTVQSPQTIISRLPSLSEKAGRDCSCKSHSTSRPGCDGNVLGRGPKPLSSKETSPTGGHTKLVPFRRSGVSKGTVQRRNSLVAKTA